MNQTEIDTFFIRLSMAIQENDRKESKGKRYNPNSLPLTLGRKQEIETEFNEGKDKSIKKLSLLFCDGFNPLPWSVKFANKHLEGKFQSIYGVWHCNGERV